MRFLIDAQLPEKLCRWIEDKGHRADYVASLLSGETPDRVIADYAAEHGYILISKDEDFVTRYPPTAYRLVWLRIGNASNRALITWLEPRFDQIVAMLDRGECLVEVR